MELFVVHHIRQNEGLARREQYGWTNVWAVEAEAMAQAGDSVAKLVGAVGKGFAALGRALVALITPAQESVPVRVAARREQVALSARNDDRAAA